MNLKKKILVGIAASTFAFAIMFNMTLFQNKENTDITLEQATIMAKANLAESLSSWFGGNWSYSNSLCVIEGTRVIHQSSCSIYLSSYGGHIYCNCTTSEERYEIQYYVSKCCNGHGSCWTSQDC